MAGEVAKVVTPGVHCASTPTVEPPGEMMVKCLPAQVCQCLELPIPIGAKMRKKSGAIADLCFVWVQLGEGARARVLQKLNTLRICPTAYFLGGAPNSLRYKNIPTWECPWSGLNTYRRKINGFVGVGAPPKQHLLRK